MENLIVKLQIIGDDDKVLISSVISSNSIKSVKELHGISILDDVYNTLIEELENNGNNGAIKHTSN